jgi:hypothetical protein
MKIVGLCLMTGLAFGLPFAASAQQGSAGGAEDVKYCNSLVRSYQSLIPAQEVGLASDAVALTRCDAEPKATIAFLEKKFADKKMDLPHDNRAAQPPSSPGNTQ